MRPETLDHVALWVADRDAIADVLTERVGMHVIDRTDAFTLVGSHARHGKLTLFAAEGPRERGALKHVALRVSSNEQAEAELERDRGRPASRGRALLRRPRGAADRPRRGADRRRVRHRPRRALVEAPEETAKAYLGLGFSTAEPGPSGAPRVEAGGAFVEFHQGEPGDPEKPLLNHLAVKVDSADDHIAEARELGLEIADIVDAANTYAVFVWGPERVKVEYVEHKPSFSLT